MWKWYTLIILKPELLNFVLIRSNQLLYIGLEKYLLCDGHHDCLFDKFLGRKNNFRISARFHISLEKILLQKGIPKGCGDFFLLLSTQLDLSKLLWW